MPFLSTFGAASARSKGRGLGRREAIVATGGTITEAGGFRIHTFTGSGTFTVSSVPAGSTVEYLIVAGGGGGATQADSNNRGGGGGGAGGLLTGSIALATGSYAITVGAGGAAADSNAYYRVGTNGGNSSAFGLTAIGGGRGGTGNNQPPQSGGSGGGGGAGATPAAGAAGTSGQGFAGGSAVGTENVNGASGGAGGGAGGVGPSNTTDGGTSSWVPGGAGLTLNITGQNVLYARGGAASPTGTHIPASERTRLGNTGDGGNSGSGSVTQSDPSAPQPGSSGIVIVRYAI